jgi:DnaK suppressor protein
MATPTEIIPHLGELRAALLGQRRRLLRQVARLENDLRWLSEDVEPEVVEEGQEEMLAQLLAGLDERSRAEIDAIERALERMERGGYGICSNCSQPIPLARLRAMPTAELCLTCARQREAGPRAPA